MKYIKLLPLFILYKDEETLADMETLNNLTEKDYKKSGK